MKLYSVLVVYYSILFNGGADGSDQQNMSNELQEASVMVKLFFYMFQTNQNI